MRSKRMKRDEAMACYHCMSRTVNGERLFGDREKEILRKMVWQVAEFSGVEVLTYALMGNHFHVLVRVPKPEAVSDAELMRRWRVLYPEPTEHMAMRADVLERTLADGGEEAEALRRQYLARMHDVSEFMKTLKQRFTIWFNKNHDRYGPLWSDRFKSVLVEGRGNPLQTMAAYIDLNAVRAGLVDDPKDYRFCGYGEAVGGSGGSGRRARNGLSIVWADHAGAIGRAGGSPVDALRAHRSFMFAKYAGEEGGMNREKALAALKKGDGVLPKAAALRCRIRYFTDGAILGSSDFVSGFLQTWQAERGRKHPPKVYPLEGAEWGDVAVIQSLRRQPFG